MIIGTAGHIDHGKTTLVRALTGVDTDRLPEEKARGISIDLGYAYTPLTNDDVLGFVDVPGHERLVHTMVAGACGIDFALLVVAADDGVMPQTREHLTILELLGVHSGAIALTKIDRVDAERLQAVRAEVVTTLASTSLKDAKVFAVNATASNDPGTQALLRYLHDRALHQPTRRDEHLFRLAVDRVFTLAGHGTVVTGTVFSGQVNVGDTVTVMPARIPVRVRSIHAQNRATELGLAGQRCALNLVGVEKTAVARGDWIADPQALEPTRRMDVHLNPPELGSPLHIHLGTAHRMAQVVPLDSGYVQLVFDTPLCAAPGDRFIARDAQAMHTVGGGVVIDPFAPARKRRSPARLAYLNALERLISGEGLGPLLEQAPYGLPIADLARLTSCSLERISLPANTLRIDERFAILRSHWQTLQARALAALREFHAKAPDEPGPDIGRLRRIALPDLSDALWPALVDELTRERAVIRSGPWIHLPEHIVRLSESEQALALKLLPLIASGGFNPPWVRSLADTVREPEELVRQVLRKQMTQGTVYQVVPDLFYGREHIEVLADIITTLAKEHGGVDAAHYRDALNLGRKRAIQILEFFDRIGYTRRIRNSHVLRADSGWRFSQRKAHAPGGAAGLQTQKGASNASW